MEKENNKDKKLNPDKFQILQEINNLQKGFLVIMEDLYADQQNYIKGVSKMFEDDDGIIDSFNPLQKEKSAHIRKRILDLGGNCMRTVESKLKEL